MTSCQDRIYMQSATDLDLTGLTDLAGLTNLTYEIFRCDVMSLEYLYYSCPVQIGLFLSVDHASYWSPY